MRPFKFFWNTHKWTGIVLAVAILGIAGTGLLLLVKKRFETLQPPTQKGTPSSLEQLLPLHEVIARVVATNHPDFQRVEDIDRIDTRLGKRVHKVRSKHNWAEIQIDAVTGEVLHQDWRPSDLIEQLHDGSYLGGWVHDWVMPVVALGLVFLVISGLYLWIEPILKRRERKRRRKQRAAA